MHASLQSAELACAPQMRFTSGRRKDGLALLAVPAVGLREASPPGPPGVPAGGWQRALLLLSGLIASGTDPGSTGNRRVPEKEVAQRTQES